MVKKIFVKILSCLIIMFVFVSCYHYETKSHDEYDVFYKQMQKRKETIFTLLPNINNKNCIDDMYLFYSDRDLIDTYYTVYVNCKYNKEEYLDEKDRVNQFFTDEDILIKNSESFEYESLMYGYLNFDEFDDTGIMTYEYVLFDESEFRIVYVALFDKELNGKSTNIPKEYLPKELNDLRANSTEGKNFFII